MEYPIVIFPLTEEEGGGFLGMAPDLLGCLSDGATQEQALANTRDAILEWIDEANERGLPVPQPFSAGERATEEKERLIAHLKGVTSGVGEVETRLDSLEETIKDLSERVEDTKAWSRFAKIVGEYPMPATTRASRLHN